MKTVQSGAGMDDRSIDELIIYLGMEINVKGHSIRDQCVVVFCCFGTTVHVSTITKLKMFSIPQ